MKELIFNLVNGVYGRIPICCNLFFTYKAYVLDGEPVAAHVYNKRTSKKFDPMDVKGAGSAHYVRCNRCHTKNKVKEIPNNGTVLRWLIGLH